MEDKKLKSLLNLDDYYYYLYLLNADVFKDRINNKSKIIKQSVECAIKCAKDLKDKNTGIYDLINKYKLVYEEENSQNIFNLYDLAVFESPNKIIFRKDNIRTLEGEIKKEKSPIFSKVNPRDIITSHEIYHLLEEDGLITDNIYISYQILGFIKKKVKLRAPSEIGAMVFAKEFLSLDFNPVVLNYFLARANNREEIIYNKLIGGLDENIL